jgi:hypothetical protein
MRTYALKCPKGKLLMTLLSKRLVGIAASTVLLSLVSTRAHAQGTWYTNRTLWQSLVTNIGIATYDGFSEVDQHQDYVEDNVASTSFQAGQTIGNGYLTTDTGSSVRFQYSVDYSTRPFHAFCGEFRTSSNGYLDFFVDNTSTGNYTYRLATSAGADSFLGYISNSASISEVIVEPIDYDYTLRVNSFNLGNRNPLDPGSNVAPEPGSFALALTGGAALIGICIRRRRNAA